MPVNPCENCHAGCCRSFAAPISGADIIRIENRLGLDFWQFVCRWADPTGRIARKHAPHFHFEDDPRTPFVICLMHAASDFLPGTTKCRFLMECPPDEDHPLGQARCGIYEARPGVCRAFPGKLSDDGELIVISEIPSHGRDDRQPVYELCPRPWEKTDIDPIQLTQDVVICRYEMASFSQVATIWNRQPRPWSLFPEFLRMVYRERVVTQSSLDQLERQSATVKFPTKQSADRRAA